MRAIWSEDEVSLDREDALVAELMRESRPVAGVGVRGVYLLFDGEELVYVGEGQNVFLRVGEATRRKMSFTHWNYLPVDTKGECLALEHALCERFRPRYNRRYRRSAPDSTPSPPEPLLGR